MKRTVVVGMSGGVDSSVSALFLKEQGYDVLGLFMKNWNEDNCPAEADYQDAVHVAEKLQIPLYTVNFCEEYWDHVFQEFIEGLKKGITPNPDILCNREIKFHRFLEKALSLGADFLATGHYCQRDDEGRLLKGADSNKDQSYFLHAVKSKQLEKTLFPIGELTKPKLREIAKKEGLLTHSKRDSTGICFIGKRNFPHFIEQYISPKAGDLITLDGEIVGQHHGAWNYTIGQRKGLGIGGAGEAWFVADKNVENNTVTVVQGENHPALYTENVIAISPTWIKETPTFPFKCSAKIRYRCEESPCLVQQEEDQTLRVTFFSPERAVTPGQAIVFYDGNLCLGGATIRKYSFVGA